MRSPLVGRNNELRRIDAVLDAHGVAVLVGPSGVGKTALCDVVAEKWESQPGRAHELRGTNGLKHVPFGALTLAMRVDKGNSEAETLERVVSALTGNGNAAMVVVDDAHLLDDQSAGLVSGLAQTADVALVLAITSGEKVSSDITSVWARWPECRIDVDPLTRELVAELITGLVGHEMSEADVDEICAVSLGYPLYVTAIVTELQAQSGAGSGNVLGSGGLSDRLVALMERRLSRLGVEERRLFDAVAFAESATARVALAGDDPILLERLDDAGLIRRLGERVQVDHPLLGSVSREAMTYESRRANASRLLAGLDDTSEDADVAAIVRKAVGVGVIPPVKHLQTAAEVAFSWGDFSGVALFTAMAPDDKGLVVLRAQASRFLGEIPTTEIPVGLDDALLTEYLSGASQGIAYGERRFGDAIEFLERGMASVVGHEHRNRLAVELMVLSGLVGDIDALLGAARSVDSSADANTRLLALGATQLAEALTLSTAASSDTYETARGIADGDGIDIFLREQLEMSRVMVDLAEGRLSPARRRAQAFGDKKLVGSWLTIESVLADAWLPAARAADLADAAVAELEQFDPLANLAQARLVSDLRHAQLGDPPGQEDSGLLLEPGVMEIDRIMTQRADAWLAWPDDDSTSGKRLIGVGREAIAMGHRFWGLAALIDATRLGHGEEVVADIEHLVITRGAGLAVLAGRHARAKTSIELWAVAKAWWTAGAPVYGLEAAIEGSDPGDPIDCLGVHILSSFGVSPVVGNMSDFECPVSPRQLEIVVSVLSGRSNDEIAEELFVSRRTVENHLHRLYSSLGLRGSREAIMDRFGWSAQQPPDMGLW